MKFQKSLVSLAAASVLALAALPAAAQVPVYGANVNIDQARKATAAAEAEAKKIGVPMAIAIVDNAGQLVHFVRQENTQTGSIQVSQDKAVSAAMFRRTTKVFQDLVAGGGAGTRVMGLRNANIVEGGIPLMIDGKIIGGIGVSGGSSDQDGVVAKAGVESLK